MQKRKSTDISEVETAIAKSDQTDAASSSPDRQDPNAMTNPSGEDKEGFRVHAAPPLLPDVEPGMSIAKPGAFSLEKFKSKRARRPGRTSRRC